MALNKKSQQQSSSSLCNLMLQQQDLKKIQQLDPYQTDGFKTLSKLDIPVNIIYTDEIGKQITDTQILSFQILTKWIKSTSYKDKDPMTLQSVRVYLLSQDDLYLNMISNINQSTFEGMKGKNMLNLHFNDFPNALVGILRNCRNNPQQLRRMNSNMNNGQLRISYEGTAKLFVTQQTQYKKLQLVELYFSPCNVQKVQQSIIFRFNYQNTKLAMLQNSIKSIYDLLSTKNQPLLQYIQKNVGINQ